MLSPDGLSQAGLAKRANDSNIGSATMEDSSASAVLSTLVPVSIIALVYFVGFIFLRRYFPEYYSPRSYIGRTPVAARHSLEGGLFAWIKALFNIPDTDVLHDNSMDAFLMLRLLKMSAIACVVGAAITWPVLLPINITGGGSEVQFNMLNIGNVVNKWKYFAHAICAWIYFSFIMYLITRETIFLISLRQAYTFSDRLRNRISTRTVLFTAVPNKYLQEDAMVRLIGEERKEWMWFPTDTTELTKVWEEREKVVARLEGAKVSMICQAVQAYNAPDGANPSAGHPSPQREKATHNYPDGKTGAHTEIGTVDSWVPEKKRPTHRETPIFGKVQDTVTVYTQQMYDLDDKIETHREEHRSGNAKRCRSVFVLFKTVTDAYDSYQSVPHHLGAMSHRYIGLTPAQIIWENLNIRAWERIVRRTASITFATVLTIFWAIPVALVASIANVDKLIELVPAFSFLNKLPSVIMGVVTGLLPVVAVAILVSLVPFFFRLAAKYGGAVSTTQVEVSTNTMFFWFQVVQVFLVATLGSAAPAVVSAIVDQPSSAASLLATNLPKSSTFYICWFILQGLGSVGSQLVGVVGLIVQKVLAWLFWNTPRKLFMGGMPRSLQLGSVYPPYTLLMVIAIGYACISPIALGFAAIALFLFWFVWRYNLLFTTGNASDTRGQLYADTLQQLFVGLYIAEICLIGLFAVGAGSSKASLGPMVLMIILLVVTILYHYNFNKMMEPLLNTMPRSITMRFRDREAGTSRPYSEIEANPTAHSSPQTEAALVDPSSAPVPEAGFITRFFKPWMYANYKALSLIHLEEVADSTKEKGSLETVYLPPSRRDDPYPIWLPDDTPGLGEHLTSGFAQAEVNRIEQERAARLAKKDKAVGYAVVNSAVTVEANGKLKLRADREEQMVQAYHYALPTDALW